MKTNLFLFFATRFVHSGSIHAFIQILHQLLGFKGQLSVPLEGDKLEQLGDRKCNV